ncbi:MAG: hypothetical protein J6Y02_23330 [Pseudobutyrivibrio sp.]|nr:hypothetical protein [Pseudobutyrivibrio sp.]
MTIAEVLALVDEIQPNTYDDNVKITWLNEFDGRVFNDLILHYEHELVDDGEGNLIEPTFTAHVSVNEELLIPDTYADIYRHWLFAQIAYANGETERYGNAMLMFNNTFDEYCRYYARNHKAYIKPLRIW